MISSDFIIEGTVQSRLLCEDISKRSGGICILAFSRGKDSIGAWLWLRQFFHTIIPFHCAYIPHLEYINRSLSYYEQTFGTRIERYIDGEASKGLSLKWWQTIERHSKIEALNRADYELEDVTNLIRRKHNCPDAPMAMAMSMHDNLFRRMNLRKLDTEGNLTYEGAFKKGFNTFYPCFDWTSTLVTEVITKSGVFLPDDYLTEAHSFSLVQMKNIERIMELFPEDFQRIEGTFPLIKAIWARNQFRRMKIIGNGVIPRTVAEVVNADKLERLEQELPNAKRSPNKRKSRK